jgi:hypothetical protein
LENGAEYRPKNSNHLHLNEESLTQIKEILALIKVHRGRIDKTCGLHIHCFKWGTNIMLPNFASKSIEGLNVGDKILGLDLKSGNLIPTKIIKKYVRNANTIDLYYGKEFMVSVTPEHPIIKYLAQTPINNRRINHFYPAEYIKTTKYISFTKNRQDENYREKSWHRGWLDGYIAGDGHIIKATKNKNSKICFHCKDKYLLEFVNICFKKLGIPKELKIALNNNKKYYSSSVGGKIIHNFLVKSHTKTKTSRFYKLGYLAGFFDAEGTQTGNEVILCNCNLQKIQLIKQYCQDLNISYKLRTRNIYKSIKKFYEFRIIPAIDFYALTHPTKLKYKSLKYWGCKDINNITYKKGAKVRVYNFETETNTYIANGLISHNCNVKNYTDGQILEIVKEFIHRQKYIIKRFEVHPDRLSDTCKPLPKENLNKLTEKQIHNFRKQTQEWSYTGYNGLLDEKYQALNISHLKNGDYGTLEFRLFDSTLSYKKLKEQINWTLNFIKDALERE